MELLLQVLDLIALRHSHLMGYDWHFARPLWLALVFSRVTLALRSLPGGCSRCKSLQAIAAIRQW